MSIGVVMPVGPSDYEVARAQDTVASIRFWEPAVDAIVVVNDDHARELCIEGATTIAHPLPASVGSVYDRIASATLAGLQWLKEHSSVRYAMKIDTDALVIAPLAEKLDTAFDRPEMGMVGSYRRTCNGDARSFGPQRRSVLRAVVREPNLRVDAARAFVHGYRLGEHVLAAACAISRPALDALDLQDPTRYARAGLGDDPLLGLLLRSRGFTFGSAIDGLFGISWRGLPDTPDRLLSRGFSVIHSVKNAEEPEDFIRQYFAARRTARCPPSPVSSHKP